MNIMRNRFKTMTEQGGLRCHMENMNKNYEVFKHDLVEMIAIDSRLNVSRLARKHRVSRNTIYGWIEQDQKELAE